MSVLSKIRERSTLLLIIIGGALVAFILGDILTSNSTLFSGGGRNDLGEISGKTISAEEFEQRLLKMEENFKLNTGQENIDDATKDMLKEQAWNQLLNEVIMTEEYKEIGITVSPQELFDMVSGPEPHQSVKQGFTNPETGVFDPKSVLNFLKTMDQDATGATKARWIVFESGIKQERIAEKYNNLIKEGLYVTNNQAKQDYIAKNKNIKFKYVVQRYNSIPDSAISVTEADIKKYYDEHKNEYEQEAGRKIEYMTFEVTPSEEDIKETEEILVKLVDDFKNTDNDSLFVKQNSDAPFNNEYLSREQLPSNIDSTLFDAEKGTVIGPYREGDAFRLAKVTDFKYSPDSVKARHILIKIANNDTTAVLAKADSLKKVIKGGKKFDEIAKNVSEDIGSATNGGDLGWFTEGAMVKPFNDASFVGKKGDMPVVISQFGVHLIEILDKSAEKKKIQITFIERAIEPSSKTFQAVYAKASEFANKYPNEEVFEKAVEEQGGNKKIAENIKEGDKGIIGLEGSRDLVRWAYKAEKGEVSKTFEFGDKYVVAVLKEIKEEGNAPLEQVREEIELAARKEKKAEKFEEDFNAAINSGASKIEDIASKLNTNPETVESINFAAVAVPGVGKEPTVIGTLFALPQGGISKPVKGETGVFIVSVESIIEPPPTTDYSANKNQLSGGLINRVGSEVFEALKENADVTDNRAKFY